MPTSSPPLLDILRGYASLSPPRYLQLPSCIEFDDLHHFFLNDLLLNPHFNVHPPSAQYQAVFWKWALQQLEGMMHSEDVEIDGQIYEHYLSLMEPSSRSQTIGVQPPSPSYITYFWRHNDRAKLQSATLLESRTTIEAGTTGLKTWLASLVLAQYLILHPELVRGKRVLEFGSGAGFLGIIVATLQNTQLQGRGEIYLTDVNPEVLRRCCHNIQLPCNISSAHPAVHCEELDWTDTLDASKCSSVRRFLQKASQDLIIGADIVYDPSIILPLVQTLRVALEGNGSEFKVALIALAVRNQATLTKFLQTAEEYLVVEKLNHDLANEELFWGMKRPIDTANETNVEIFQLQYRHA